MEELFFSEGTENTGGSPENAQEGSRESSEKQRYNTEKAIAGIKKARKDEGRARVYSDLLLKVLVELIRDSKNDTLSEKIVELLRINTPSAFVLAIVSIANHLAYKTIIQHFNQKEIIISTHTRIDSESFKESNLEKGEREKINEWVEILFLSLTENASVIFVKKVLAAIEKKEEKNIYIESIAWFFTLFLSGRNIYIPIQEAQLYAEFIILQLEKRLHQEKLEDF